LYRYSTGVLLRLALPRIAALQAVGGFDELSDLFGLPPRAELSGYLDQLQAGVGCRHTFHCVIIRSGQNTVQLTTASYDGPCNQCDTRE
jgi:hypothetical protein